MEYLNNQLFSDLDFTQNLLEKAEYFDCRFSGCNFSHCDLSGFIFENCSFENCDLSMAMLNNTAMREANFKNCKLLGLRFENCNKFSLAFGFDSCSLQYASFFQVKAPNTVFKHCKLSETDFAEADFSGAVFEACDLELAIFEGTKLTSADFSSAYNFSIDPDQNSLEKAKFSAQNLGGLLQKYKIVIV